MPSLSQSGSPLGRGANLDDLSVRVLRALLAMQRQSWEQGVASHAFLDLGLTELARVVARDCVLRQSDSGKLADLADIGAVNCGATAAGGQLISGERGVR